jgi:hypothetical protein
MATAKPRRRHRTTLKAALHLRGRVPAAIHSGGGAAPETGAFSVHEAE